MDLEVVSEMGLPQEDAIAVHVGTTKLLRVLVMHFFVVTQQLLTGE